MHPNELSRLLIDQEPDAVIYADREGIIREWNPAAVAMFGFTSEEAVGRSLDIIVPERFREAHWRWLRASFQRRAYEVQRTGLANSVCSQGRLHDLCGANLRHDSR